MIRHATMALLTELQRRQRRDVPTDVSMLPPLDVGPSNVGEPGSLAVEPTELMVREGDSATFTVTAQVAPARRRTVRSEERDRRRPREKKSHSKTVT